MTSGPGTREPARIFGPQHRRLSVGIVATIVFVAFEAMAVATAMPKAVADLDGVALYSLAFSAFLTTALVGMVLSGQLCDWRGPVTPVLAGVSLFAAGLVIAGTVQSMWPFVIGRATQGMGGGMIVVALYVIVGRSYDSGLRPRIFAAMSAGWVMPSIVGPLVAGLTADHLSWRLVFLGIAPLVLLPVGLALPAIRATGNAGAAAGAGTRKGRIGLAVVTALGMAVLQYAGTHPSLMALLLAAAGVALLVPSLPRLLPAGALRLRRGLPTVVAMRGILAGAFFGTEAFIPLMLVTERGVSSTLAGLSLTGGALGWATGSWYQGRSTLTVPRHLLVRYGCAFVASGIAAVGLVLVPVVPFYVAAVAWTLGAVGMGLGMASISVLLLQLSPTNEQGTNSSALQLSDALGSIVFIGLAGTIFGSAHGGSAGMPVNGPVQISSWVFAVILGVMASLAASGAWAAGRIHGAPRS